jgi:hypothetical protein
LVSRKKLLPAVMTFNIFIRNVVSAKVRCIRLPYKAHARLVRRMPRLTAVAPTTSANYIFPYVSPTPVPWYHMIQSEGSGLSTTILTGIFITLKHLSPAKFLLLPRPLYQTD